MLLRLRRGEMMKKKSQEGKIYDHSPTVVIDHILSQLFTQLAQYNILIEEFALIAVLKVFSDTLPHIPW